MDPSRKRPTISTPRIRSLRNRVSVMFARREEELKEKNKEILNLKQQLGATKELVRHDEVEFFRKEEQLRIELLKASELNVELRKENVMLNKSVIDHREAVNALCEENKAIREENLRLQLDLDGSQKHRNELEMKIRVMEIELDESFTFDDEDISYDQGVELAGEVPKDIEYQFEGNQRQEVVTVKVAPVDDEGTEETTTSDGTGIYSSVTVTPRVEKKTEKRRRDSSGNRKRKTPNSSPVSSESEERRSPRQLTRKAHAMDTSADSFSCVCGARLESKEGLRSHIKLNNKTTDQQQLLV